jgi:hypothetical protein
LDPLVTFFRELILHHKQQRALFSDEDWARFQSLPARFKVYRGCRASNRAGVCWTLDRAWAEFFAKRAIVRRAASPGHDSPGEVRECIVGKKDVLFYTDGRTEQEVVLLQYRAGRLIGVIPKSKTVACHLQ